MGVKAKGKHRLDKFYHLAKEQGFRSRAAFKLIQLESKFSLLNTSRSILDLCAAPGGWMQVAVKYAPVGSLIIGVDLFPIKPIYGAIAVQEDITKPKCRATIKRLLAENGFKAFDLVVHDGSPNVGGAWSQEATSQNALVIDSIKLATEFLAPKANFLTKVFRSQDYSAVLYCLKQFFEKVEVTKPVASRSTSAEIYVIGLRYKGPAKIDPRLLDFKYLFQGATEPQKVTDDFRGNKQKRHRDGYEDGLTLVRKVCSASDFVWSGNPADMLFTATTISFDDPSSLPLKDHALTTEEVKCLCEDLSVLGMQDRKHLLKWRLNIRKAIPSAVKTVAAVDTAKEEDDVGKVEQDEDEKLELTHSVDRKKKREKELLAKRRAKDQARKATGMQADATLDGYVDNELFSLTSIKGKEDLATVDTTDDVEAGELAGSEDEADNDAKDRGESIDDLDSDQERERYDEELEKMLDEAYERYISKKDGSTRQRRRAKNAYADGFLEDAVDAEDAVELDDSNNAEDEQEANPLVVSIDMDKEPTQEEIKQRWFCHDVFFDAMEDGDLQKDGSDEEMQVDLQEQKVALPRKTGKCIQNKSGSDILLKSSAMVKEDEIEIVPAPATDSSDSSSSEDESEGYDIDTKTEVRALAEKMLGNKRKRQEIEDMGYHKRMFDENLESLPEWFVRDQKLFNQSPKLVTKEEIQAERAFFKEINTRPAKKVAEAKARKKRAAMRNLEKIRKKANSISDQSDIPDRSKTRMIEQLYKKATPRKPKKELVVAKKGVQVRAGKGKVLVDRRMKKDFRQEGMSKNGKKGKKNGKVKGKATRKTGKSNRRLINRY